jgi:hypothetical protein
MSLSPTVDRRATTTARSSRATHLTPRRMARLYTEYLSALWRGDDVSAITNWLEARWNSQGPYQPADSPDAVSLIGGSSVGENRISWYQHGNTILGYPAGHQHGAYRIPATETPPPITD